MPKKGHKCSPDCTCYLHNVSEVTRAKMRAGQAKRNATRDPEEKRIAYAKSAATNSAIAQAKIAASMTVLPTGCLVRKGKQLDEYDAHQNVWERTNGPKPKACNYITHVSYPLVETLSTWF